MLRGVRCPPARLQCAWSNRRVKGAVEVQLPGPGAHQPVGPQRRGGHPRHRSRGTALQNLVAPFTPGVAGMDSMDPLARGE